MKKEERTLKELNLYLIVLARFLFKKISSMVRLSILFKNQQKLISIKEKSIRYNYFAQKLNKLSLVKELIKILFLIINEQKILLVKN